MWKTQVGSRRSEDVRKGGVEVAGRDEKRMPAGKMAEPERRRRKTVEEMPHGEMEEPAGVEPKAVRKRKTAPKKGGKK
jgi:hypothetical protein